MGCARRIVAEGSLRPGPGYELAPSALTPLANWESIPNLQDMIPRLLRRQIVERLAGFPAVAVLGPRQCGKTTLARSWRGAWFDLEAAGDATRLDVEWDTLVNGRRLVILDEAQRIPELFPRLRAAIDGDRKRNGRFLLLGSVSPELMRGVSESLAGRLSTVRLAPLLLPELRARQLDDLWLCGGFPDGGVLGTRTFPVWQDDYLEALITRDLPTWGLPTRPQQTRRLLRMLATCHAQTLNASQLGASLSLDHKTVVRYCDFLEGAFLIRLLQPFSTNTQKRLVRSPRLLWRDSGLLHALSGVTSLEQLYAQPWVGSSWEGFVIEQTIGTAETLGLRCRPYWFRTSDGYELDLVLDFGTERWAIEVKLTSHPTPAMVQRLERTADLIDASRRILVCRVSRKSENATTLVTHLSGWLNVLSAMASSR